MEVRYDSYCGLNCGACPVGMANEQSDEEALSWMASQWKKERQDLTCTGCKTDVTASFCTACAMRKCAMEKNLDFCFQCGDYPCETITNFRDDDAPHHSAVFSNLAGISKKGIEEWLRNEKERWACGSCGTRFNWYMETCPRCGEELYNSVKEEKDLRDQP